jgi:hypothetical protein
MEKKTSLKNQKNIILSRNSTPPWVFFPAYLALLAFSLPKGKKRKKRKRSKKKIFFFNLKI